MFHMKPTTLSLKIKFDLYREPKLRSMNPDHIARVLEMQGLLVLHPPALGSRTQDRKKPHCRYTLTHAGVKAGLEGEARTPALLLINRGLELERDWLAGMPPLKRWGVRLHRWWFDHYHR